MEATDCVCVGGNSPNPKYLAGQWAPPSETGSVGRYWKGQGCHYIDRVTQRGKEGVGELHLEDRTQDGAGWLYPSSANQSKCGGKGKGVGSSKSVSKKNQEELKFSETWGVWVRP